MASLLCLLAAPALPAVALADTVEFEDGIFNPSEWGFEIVGSGTSTPSQIPLGGNPGSYRRITQSVTANSGWFYAFSRYGTNSSTRYEATMFGAIASVDFKVQAQTISVINGQIPGLAFALKQGGQIYVQSPFMNLSGPAWNTFSATGLVASNFYCINGPGIPDFSATGMPIRFGFVTMNASFSAAITGGVTEYDNFKVVVNIAPCFGDLDGSGEVDSGDVGLMLLDFGPCPGCPSDLDGSGEVDGADIGLLLLGFGACP
ncbi:MAG: hypothetical protein K8R92_11910 [Planctomycetes bacterium]|nr:hypothetical protein [Planctomycetota bacterium]